jgi:two-component system, sensor histidine kinase PdtaS
VSYVDPDYDAPDETDDDDRDFTAEHVGLVVPPVDQAASRHLKRLVAGWGMLADLSFSDLLLYVPLQPTGVGGRRYLVVNQVRPNTGQTLFLDDVVGRTMDETQRPAVAQAAASGEIVETVVDSVWLGEQIRVTAIPVRHHGSVVAVVARESPVSMARQRGDLERVYLDVFERLARMVAAGEFPFDEEEVVSTGGPRVGDGVVLLDGAGRVEFASPNAISALRRLGVSGRIQSQTLTGLGAQTSTIYRAFATAHPAAEEVALDETVVVLRCIPLIEDRRVGGAVLLMRDVSEIRSRDRLLVSKDATIKEIHHRVKNNLQTISSLLRLQGRRLTEPTAKAAIEESVRRIRSIALVHETLSREDGDEVDLGEIVRPLVRMVEEGLTSPERPVEFRISGDGGKLPSPEATSLAVILTELLQNVVDHAYPPGTLGRDERGVEERATVGIELSRSAGTLMVDVVDDGVGIHAGFDPATTTSLGLSIVRGLVSELGGSIAFAPAVRPAEAEASGRRVGTAVSLTIPLVSLLAPDADRPPGTGGRSVGL